MNRPLFVAYVYPGWHADPYRPGVDEWSLLDDFRSYFDGHEAPAEPLGGRYDDTDPATAAGQIDVARSAGVAAFTYFLYRGPDGFVLDRPMELAGEVADDGFSIGATWCVRLPHDTFPVLPGDRLEPADDDPYRDAPPQDRPIQRLTLRDFADLIDEWDESWLDVPLTPRVRLRARTADSGPGTKDRS